MPRFVVLEHTHRNHHWDFMLEWGPVLRTWALQEPPKPNVTIAAGALFDHRLKYLDYEGPISGDRGEVTRWDTGQYELIRETPDLVQVRLSGSRLAGEVTLELRGPSKDWTFYLRSG